MVFESRSGVRLDGVLNLVRSTFSMGVLHMFRLLDGVLHLVSTFDGVLVPELLDGVFTRSGVLLDGVLHPVLLDGVLNLVPEYF